MAFPTLTTRGPFYQRNVIPVALSYRIACRMLHCRRYSDRYFRGLYMFRYVHRIQKRREQPFSFAMMTTSIGDSGFQK